MRVRLTTIGTLLVVLMLLSAAGPAAAQQNGGSGSGPTSTRSVLDFIKAGGWVGHTIILLSVVGGALVVDAFLRFRAERLMPAALVAQSEELARRGRFTELLNLSRSSDSMLGRIISSGLTQGQMGMAMVRETTQDAGTGEITRLQQRIGYISFIASVAPMLGLLGTVTGMISSFNVLGMAKGAARPDQLAIGVSEALVTTCEGLIVAVPLMFFSSYFANRLTRVGQHASTHCERLMQIMTTAMEARLAARPPGQQAHAQASYPVKTGEPFAAQPTQPASPGGAL